MVLTTGWGFVEIHGLTIGSADGAAKTDEEEDGKDDGSAEDEDGWSPSLPEANLVGVSFGE